MKYPELKQEITEDPAGIGYAGMTDEEAANALNSATVASRQLIPLWQVKKTCIETGAWLAILDAADSHEDKNVRGAAASTIIYVEDKRFENLDMDLASTQQMLGALVSGGVVSTVLVTSLDAMADHVDSRLSVLGLPFIGAHHVKTVRETA